MGDNRKQAVSIRLGRSDVRNMKRLAARLGVRDSDVLRISLKWLLNRLSPLCDPEIRGRHLVPVFVEAGAEVVSLFDLDAFRLEAILNDGADPDSRVAHEDVALLAMNGNQEPYLRLRLGAVNGANGAGLSLRDYLYDKYVYGQAERQGRRAREVLAEAELPLPEFAAG